MALGQQPQQPNRQMIVIGDPRDVDLFTSPLELIAQRQAIEIKMMENIEMSINQQSLTRGRERPFTLDRRGSVTGRGATR